MSRHKETNETAKNESISSKGTNGGMLESGDEWTYSLKKNQKKKTEKKQRKKKKEERKQSKKQKERKENKKKKRNKTKRKEKQKMISIANG